jgi:hypothetical protein
MLSILHISDLHRSADDPISNDELLASLVIDRQRYTRAEHPITAPSAIVVSGDIIQGVGLGAQNSSATIRDQYAVAEDFLCRLADEFVGGDRSQVVIAPGNHDVDWNLAKGAMDLVPTDAEPSYQKLLSPTSEYRWSWKEKRFYRIARQMAYAQRLTAYWDFIERFYGSTIGIPHFARDHEFGLFSLWQGRVGVAVFNSCLGNDCFAYHGAISPNAIALARQEMSRRPQYQLWAAVWHHSVQGTPYRTDYMDIEQVRNMLGYGFRLGMHGHQHKHQVLPTHVDLPDRETMALVSAGSLCAGGLVVGWGFFGVLYIVEISDDLMSAQVHVRQMETAHLFSGCHLTATGGRTYVDVEWSPQPDRVPAGPRAASLFDAVIQAERLIGSNRDAAAVEVLSSLMPQLSGYGRTLFVQAAIRTNRWELLLEKVPIPDTVLELTALVEACDRLRLAAKGIETLQRFAGPLGMTAQQQQELTTRLKIRGGDVK